MNFSASSMSSEATDSLCFQDPRVARVSLRAAASQKRAGASDGRSDATIPVQGPEQSRQANRQPVATQACHCCRRYSSGLQENL